MDNSLPRWAWGPSILERITPILRAHASVAAIIAGLPGLLAALPRVRSVMPTQTFSAIAIVIYHTPVKDARADHTRQSKHRLVLGTEHVEYLTKDNLGAPSWRSIDRPAYKAKLIELALRHICTGGSRGQVVSPHVDPIEIHLDNRHIPEASDVLAREDAESSDGE